MRTARGAFDIHAWAPEIPLLSNPTIQAAIIGPDGRLVSTTLDPPPEPIDVSDREHFRIHLDGRFQGIFIGKPVMGRVSHQVTINVTRRVDAEDGSFLGVIMFALSPANLTTLNTSIDLGPHGTIALIGMDDMVRARFTREDPNGLAGIGQQVGHPWAATIPPNGEGTFVKESVIDHITRLFSYRRVGNYPLVVTVGSDLAEALASSREHARVIAAITGLATFLLAGLAAYLIREIRHRTSHEIALADERDKLQAASDRLEADIALREGVEQKLREIQATLRDAVDSISEGFVIFDRDDCFVMCNEPYRELYPKAARLMIPGTPFEEIVWANLDAGWVSRCDRVRTGMARQSDEHVQSAVRPARPAARRRALCDDLLASHAKWRNRGVAHQYYPDESRRRAASAKPGQPESRSAARQDRQLQPRFPDRRGERVGGVLSNIRVRSADAGADEGRVP
ncbi:MAG TPA: PAS-domain containing protein, partial [Roseiarcus sp.]